MFVVDLEQERIISDDELKRSICSQKPYAEWLNKYKIRLEELPEPRVLFTHLEYDQIFKYQKAFGYTTEDLDTLIAPMCLDGKEPLGSMGTDVPLAVLSDQPQHLSSYFKQLFAQVTNPPIDPIRERLVMSLATFAGGNANLLEEDPLACHSVALKQPILSNHELEKIRSIDTGVFQAKTLQTYFRADGKPGSLQAGLDRLCRYAVDAVNDGFEVLVLTDRAIDSDHAPIPSLLATAAVHHHLIRKGFRGQVGIIVEAGDVWEVHHFACLIGFGATAINPYLALSTIRDMKLTDKLQTDLDAEQLKKNYIKAVCEGLLKVFSKMGISTLQSYQGAQIFEIIGLNRSVVDKYFTGATSRIEGMGLDEIAKEVLAKHFFAFSRKDVPIERLMVGGVYQWKRKGEFHLFNPATVHLLQHSTRMNDYNSFKKYSKLVNDQSEGRYPAEPPPVQTQPPLYFPRRSRAGREHLQTFRHRRHVLRLHLARSPLHPGHRNEPPRRQEQNRRSWGGRGSVMRSCPTATPCARLSNRSHPPASGSRATTSPWPTNYRSKWRREPNPAKVDSCPATKWTNGSGKYATRHPV